MSNQCTEKSINYKIAYTSFAGTYPTTELDFRYSLLVLSKSQLIAEIIHFGFLAISFYELIPKNVKTSSSIRFSIESLTHIQLDIFVQLSLKHQRKEFYISILYDVIWFSFQYSSYIKRCYIMGHTFRRFFSFGCNYNK